MGGAEMPGGTLPGVEIAKSRDKLRGRCLKATRNFEAGELIAEFTSPLLVLPDAAHQQTTCHYCLSQAPAPIPGASTVFKLRACTACRSVRYCSTSCQKADWDLVHSRECKAFQRVRARAGKDWLPTPVRALVQLLLRFRDPAVQAAFGGSGATALEGNVARFRTVDDGKLWSDMELQAMAAAVYAGVGESKDKVELAREMLCKVHTNAFDRADMDSGQAGIFLDPTLAMINHSCVPNAFVGFVKRKAILRAEGAINQGDEIEISYVDTTMPKTARHQHLRLYHLDCQCRRCIDDLDVYQVCAASPLISLNRRLSVAPSSEDLQVPPLDRPRYQEVTKAQVEQIYADCQRVTSRGLERLRERWALCQPLVRAGMWAVEPLAQTVVETAIMFHSDHENYAYALSLACFAGTQADPYRFVPPFKPWRVKGIMMIARLLAITAQQTASGHTGQAVSPPDLKTAMERSDQVSMCEAMLLMVLHWGPMAHTDDWDVVRMAQSMIADLRTLAGREKQSALLNAWATDTDSTGAGRAFFEDQVLDPVRRLAGFAVQIMTAELQVSGALTPR